MEEAARNVHQFISSLQNISSFCHEKNLLPEIVRPIASTMSPLNRSFTFTSLFTSLRSRASRELIKGFLIGFTLSVSSFTVAVLLSTLQAARRARNLRRAALESGNEDGYDGGIKTVQIKTNEIVDGVIGLIGELKRGVLA